MPRVRLTAKGRRRRVQDVLGWDEDRARSTREHSSSEFQPSPDKPHWAPSSLADRQKGGGRACGAGTSGSVSGSRCCVWLIPWKEGGSQRRGTGTLARQGEKEKVPRPPGLDPLRISHLALQTAKRQRIGALLISFLSTTSFLAFSTLGRGSVPDSLFLLYLVPRVRFTEPEKVAEGKKGERHPVVNLRLGRKRPLREECAAPLFGACSWTE